MGSSELLMRLGVAALIGVALGLNRYLNHKSIGVRTLGLVSVIAAAIVASIAEISGPDGVSRVIQGLVTGIGFIGAGLIMREPGEHSVHGLTTAATVWVAAALGIMCGLGVWRVVGIAGGLVALLLLGGGRLEKAIAHHFGGKDEPPSKPAKD